MIGLLKMVLVGVPATIWYASRVILAVRWGRPNAAALCDELPRKWARLLLRATRVRVRLENVDAIDPERPQVLVANHVSWFDVLALTGHVPGAFRFVAKKELETVPFFGPAWQACGHISIDRDDRQRAIASLEVARAVLERDRPTVILFPEGTRSWDGSLRPFKKGAFVLAIQTGVEVVPAAILGSRDVMAKGSWRIRPGTITVRFGDPIQVGGMSADDRDLLTRRAREAVLALGAGARHEDD